MDRRAWRSTHRDAAARVSHAGRLVGHDEAGDAFGHPGAHTGACRLVPPRRCRQRRRTGMAVRRVRTDDGSVGGRVSGVDWTIMAGAQLIAFWTAVAAYMAVVVG